jgi:hypothetical protein
MMADRSDKLVDVECVVRLRREKAIAVADGTMLDKGTRHEREKYFWLPLSLVQENDDGTVTMPEFLAIEKGLA